MSGPRQSRPPYVVLGSAIGAAVALLLVLLVVPPLALLHRQDLPAERLYGDAAVTLATRLGGAGDQQNPLAGNPRAVQTGRDAYTGSCAQCHGDSGNGKGVWGQATYPPATDLTSKTVQARRDAQLFWIVKNGLSFAGMPAFKDQYSDQDLWSLVSYIRALQQNRAASVAVPTPTTEQLAEADPRGSSVQRGAAIYFAQGCQTCHGAIGNAPGNLGLRSGRQAAEAVRRGRPGMPVYSTDQITDAQLADLSAFVDSFAGQQQGLQPGQFQPASPANQNRRAPAR